MDDLADAEPDDVAEVEVDVVDTLVDDSANSGFKLLGRAVKYWYRYLKYEVSLKVLSTKSLNSIRALDIAVDKQASSAMEILSIIDDADLTKATLGRFGKHMFSESTLLYKTAINYLSSVKVHLLSSRPA